MKKYLKRIFHDVMDRIFVSRKSTVAGLIALVSYLAAVFGLEVPSDILAGISSGLLVLIGLLKRD